MLKHAPRSTRRQGARRSWNAIVAAGVLLAAPAVLAGEVPGVLVTLEVTTALPLGEVPSALPARFVLLEDGHVFVGGTSQMVAGRLDKVEVKDLEQRLALVRKMPGFAARIAFGDAPLPSYRLQSPKSKLDAVVSGDLGAAPPALGPMAALLRDLSEFHHASLRPYEPASFLLSAVEAPLVGGCRPWRQAPPLAEVLASPRAVDAKSAYDWPTGALPAFACDGDRRFVVTHRPLLPGERP
jgi:hypothetical protein